MFCPNCGRNCRNERFCSECGTKLPQETEKSTILPTGQTSLYCGGTMPEGGYCPLCGARLKETVTQKKTEEDFSADIPCGLYRGVMSSITLYDTACVVMQTPRLFKKHETRIPYNQITSLMYFRAGYIEGTLGYLLIRWEGNKNEPIPEGKQLGRDLTTVVIPEEDDTLFYHIYYMLKAMAPQSAEFKMYVPSVDVYGSSDVINSSDLNSYFRMYAPFREKAAEALRQTTGVKLIVAKSLIKSNFDAQQKVKYDAAPIEAIGDLNRIVKEIQRQKAEQLAKEERERMERSTMQQLEEITKRQSQS